MTADRRYTDTDVRGNPDLLSMAVSYARGYMGEFEPLVEARTLAVAGTLPVAIARKVLNCMRHDANVQHLLPEPTGTQSVVRNNRPVRPEAPKVTRLQAELKPRFMYAWSTQPRPDRNKPEHYRPSLAHILRREGSGITWWSSGTTEAVLRTLCGNRILWVGGDRYNGGRRGPVWRLGNEHQRFAEDHDFCLLCVRDLQREAFKHDHWVDWEGY